MQHSIQTSIINPYYASRISDRITISQVIHEYNDASLLWYLHHIENEGNHEKVMEMCTNGHDGSYCSTLILALKLQKSVPIVLKLIDIGGSNLVWAGDDQTALHLACGNGNRSIEIVSRLIEVGGRGLVMKKNGYGETALHVACANNITSRDISIILKLIEIGGRELVLAENAFEETALHCICWNESPSLDIISKMIEIGGRELVMKNNNYANTALHFACKNKNALVDIRVISKLLQIGGKELVIQKDGCGDTVLHLTCWNKKTSHNFIYKLIAVGQRELLMIKNRDGNIALHSDFLDSHPKRGYNNTFALLLKVSITANVGGEFGVGGLFNVAGQKMQDRIYEKWDKELSPMLKSIVDSFQEHQKPPVLHAAILAKAPSSVIQHIIDHFEYSVLKVDSQGRYPIEAALAQSLGWKRGLRRVLEATALAQQQQPSNYIAAKYGLKWGYHMKELAQANVEDAVCRYDSLTGLRLFMVAAMGDRSDLSTIYGLMKMLSPEINNTYSYREDKNKRRRLG